MTTCSKTTHTDTYNLTNLYPNDGVVKKLTSYPIEFKKETFAITGKYTGGLGSGLYFKEQKNNKLYFYMLTDRGPNFFGPNSTKGERTIIFADKNFSPYVGIVEVIPGKSAKLIDGLKLKENDKLLHGNSPPNHTNGSNQYISLDENFNEIKFNNIGIDPEGITLDKQGNLWISEEYIPSIMKFDQKGNLLKKYSPGNGLPKIISEFHYNLGIEAIATAPNGKIYAMMEGVLNINSETAKFAEFVRFVEFDPISEKTRMFLYPHEQNIYKKVKDAKNGDIVSIDNNHFLVIEQGLTKNDTMQNKIFLIDISNATDITDIKLPNDKELEYASITELKSLGINLVKKKEFLDPRNYGWNLEKMEGITILDEKTIAISNDNDFGIKNSSIILLNNEYSLNDFILNTEDKKIYYKKEGKPALGAKIKINPIDSLNPHSYIWIFELENNIPYYSNH